VNTVERCVSVKADGFLDLLAVPGRQRRRLVILHLFYI
jgi:hypothetical protein